MTSAPFAWVLGLILDPRFGIPFLVLVEGSVLWFAWSPRPLAPLGARRQSWHRPGGDPVSRMYYALRDQQFSTLVRWSRERIEELYQARSGGRLPAFPWSWRHRSTGPTDPYVLRRLTLDLGGFEWEAREREIGLHVRWAFWRSRARDQTLYKARVDHLLARAHAAIAALEGSAP